MKLTAKSFNKLLSVVTAAALVISSCMFLCVENAAAADDEKALNARLDALYQQVSDLEAQMNEANADLYEITAELDNLEADIQEKNEEIEATTKDLDDAVKRQEKQYSDMCLRIKYTYENSGQGFFEILLETGDLSQFLTRMESIELLNTYDRDMLQEYIETRELIEKKKADLEKEQADLEALEKDLIAKEADAEALVSSLGASLGAYETQLADLEAQKAELEAKKKAEEEAKKKAEEAKNSGKAVSEGQTTETRDEQHESYSAAASETDMLAAIIFCEAGNQAQIGKIAVGAVVMNRVRSGSYPNSIEGVIRQNRQFSPVSMGWFDRVLSNRSWTSSCYEAALSALAGQDPTGGLTHFRTNNGRAGLVIGDHVFY